jgi:hypothetical protein
MLILTDTGILLVSRRSGVDGTSKPQAAKTEGGFPLPLLSRSLTILWDP